MSGSILTAGTWPRWGARTAKESRLRIWEIATGSQVVVSEPTVAIRTGRMAFSPDGTTLAAGDSTGSVRLWNAETGRERLAYLAIAGLSSRSP